MLHFPTSDKNIIISEMKPNLFTFQIPTTDGCAGGPVGMKVGPERGPGGVDEERHQKNQGKNGENGQKHEEGRRVEQHVLDDHLAELLPVPPKDLAVAVRVVLPEAGPVVGPGVPVSGGFVRLHLV